MNVEAPIKFMILLFEILILLKSSNDAMIISKSSINWERVNTILDEKRKESMNFLYKSLKP